MLEYRPQRLFGPIAGTDHHRNQRLRGPLRDGPAMIFTPQFLLFAIYTALVIAGMPQVRQSAVATVRADARVEIGGGAIEAVPPAKKAIALQPKEA